MPVVCYQIGDFSVDGDVVSVQTRTLEVPETNLLNLLRLVSPSVLVLGPVVGSLFDLSYRYRVTPGTMPSVLSLLEQHRQPVVTAMTKCDLSVCLDFYQHPVEGTVPVSWQRTEIGALVYGAKYGGLMRKNGPLLAERVVKFVRAHPLMRAASGVAAVPSSQQTGVASTGLVAGIAHVVSRETEIPLVRLERVAVTAVPQKNVTGAVDPDANQSQTMSASPRLDGTILVIDDLMRHGSTIDEAARALRAAGAGRIVSLTLAKERTGTRRYQFD